jgi:hypothetical protein
MTQQPQSPRQLRLEIPATLSTTYSNATMISQTHSEIVLDFIQILPNDPRARVQARVVLTPANAKMFLQALETNLKRFEEKHGEITTPPTPISLADQLFGTIRSGDEEQPPNG